MLLPLIIPGEPPDRRRRPRLKLAYSVRLRRSGVDSLVETKTENVSCEGFLCVTDCIFHLREILGCELVIPGEREGVASDHDIVLSCRAEVVRVESAYRQIGLSSGVSSRRLHNRTSR